MKNISITLILAVLTMLCSCAKIDNYVAPNGGVHGILTDKITKENFQSEQPNGFTVKLFEKGGKQNSPIVFQGKPNESYENAFVFQNDYRLLVTEGAFFALDTVAVNIGKSAETNFEVMPFLAVMNPVATAESGKITVSYRLKREQVGHKIIERKVLVSKVPTVNNSVFDFKTQTDLTALDDTAILAANYTDTVSGLVSGQTYYIRVAARTDNVLKKYNYSKIFTVKIP